MKEISGIRTLHLQKLHWSGEKEIFPWSGATFIWKSDLNLQAKKLEELIKSDLNLILKHSRKAASKCQPVLWLLSYSFPIEGGKVTKKGLLSYGNLFLGTVLVIYWLTWDELRNLTAQWTWARLCHDNEGNDRAWWNCRGAKYLQGIWEVVVCTEENIAV